MPAAAKGLVHNHMICNYTIGTGMAPMIFWSANAEGACVIEANNTIALNQMGD
jgi:hypothetical protein